MDSQEAREAIESEDYKDLRVLEVGVDDLADILRENGFEETDRGKDGFLYETVAENATYSISVLEAEKDEKNILLTVEQENGVPLIVGLQGEILT